MLGNNEWEHLPTMKKIGLAFFLMLIQTSAGSETCPWLLPVKTADRRSWETVCLTPIGAFGLERKARPGIPAHLHTGVDIARPSDNYRHEPIYPAWCGKVISMRSDGPYGQVIVEHRVSGQKLWSAYEHLAGITVVPGDRVSPDKPMARFLTRKELNRWGWQFDHLHFEIFKIEPCPSQTTKRLPFYYFYTHNLSCYTRADLDRCYYDPETLLKAKWRL